MNILNFVQALAAIGSLCFGITLTIKRSRLPHPLGEAPSLPSVGLHLSMAVFLVCAGLRHGIPGLSSWESLAILACGGMAFCRALLTVRPIFLQRKT